MVAAVGTEEVELLTVALRDALRRIEGGTPMDIQQATRSSRRRFLGGLTFAGTAGPLGLLPRPAAAEPPPETTRIRVHHSVSLCLAPQYVAEELLRAEGFTEIHYVPPGEPDTPGGLASGAADISNDFAPILIMAIDAGVPVTILGGVHVGCFELFGTERVRAIRDLKGKNVAVRGLGSPPHLFLASMVAYVGLDPGQDINWVVRPPTEAMELLAEGKIDALIAFPPDPQELRARQIGRLVVSSALDRPWSQYFCCMTVANREFARNYPIATKRALRAFLKAADICALEPERAARSVLASGVAKRYDYALQTMQDIPYGLWREYDPEDTIRFYALRLHEIGMIQSTPQTIIENGTDWSFFSDIKKTLKG
jgi:NitT/TauT family transport system substrate-binding protein